MKFMQKSFGQYVPLAAGVLLANFFAFTLAEPEEAYINTLKIEGVEIMFSFCIQGNS